MSTYTNGVFVNTSTGTGILQATDTLAVSLLTVPSGGTLTLTGATVVGFTAPAGATITDGTGTFGFSGAAGALSGTGLSTINLIGGSGAAVALGATGSGTLGLRTVTGGLTIGDSTGTMAWTGTGGIGLSGVTTLGLNVSGAVTINSSGGSISIGNNADSQNISIGSGGTRTIGVGSATATVQVNSSGGAYATTIKAAQSGALTVTDGTTTLHSINTSSMVEGVGLLMSFTGGSIATPTGISGSETAGEALAIGDVVCRAATTGRIVKADNNTAGKKNVLGTVVRAAAGDGSSVQIARTGVKAPCTIDTTPTTANLGAYIWLGTGGQATLTKPTTAGVRALIIGQVASASGNPTEFADLQIQYVSDN
jgi:hypothetical protein